MAKAEDNTEDLELEDYPMKLEVELGEVLVPLITLSRTQADFEEDHEIKNWLSENNINYNIAIDEESNCVDLTFDDFETESYFALRWVNAS